MITLMQVIQVLRPGAQCRISGVTYNDIIWDDKNQTIPTEEEVTAKVTELETAEPHRVLRIERNRRLAECDWTQLKDISLDSIREKNWKEYRQALRDLPNGSTPKLNSDGDLDMSSVTWPDKPSS